MYLVPADIGPLHPKVEELAVALPVFALCLFAVARALPRLHRARARRDDRTHGAARRAEAVRARAERERAETVAVLAEAGRDASRTSRRASDTSAHTDIAPVTEAHMDGPRERDTATAAGQVRTEARRAEVEAELRLTVSELASDLAARIVGERLSEPGSRSHG
ncbi:hypothetical protein ACFVT5_33070 [Streptomyces sp. NPDC058001]|uniref:hypothetical protein n=1 Tax=Streptomyces sp. NPDC058001 TaxID=3346300 RepID=UPI0036EAB136